jgi:hypothetical protein
VSKGSSCDLARGQVGGRLCEEVLKAVPHRHFIFSLPKILRRYFLYDRRLNHGRPRKHASIMASGSESLRLGERHLGSTIYCGPRIQPGDDQAMENIARYIIRASFSQERMTSIPEESKVSYQSKDGKEEKVFDALEWLAAMWSHVPDKGEQMVRSYGYSIIVMFHEASGKKKIRIPSSLPSWSRTDHPKPALVRRIFLLTLRLCTIPGLSFQVYITGDRSGPGSIERTGHD